MGGGCLTPLPAARRSCTAGSGETRLHAIQASLAYVDAQHEYAEKDRTGAGAGVYARRFVSQPGRRDGLYWPTSAR